MRLKKCLMLLPSLSGLLLLGQNSPVLQVTPPEPVTAKPGSSVTSKLTASLNEGFHMNSNAPTEKYLIPLTLKWTLGGAVESADVEYPRPEMLKLPFETKPLSVLTGKMVFTTKFKLAPGAAAPATITGKLRYQACNDKACFPPKTLEIKQPIQ